MKNNFIKILMRDRNEFRTTADFLFCGLMFRQVDIKIDTVCSHTSIPVSKLGINAQDAYVMKQKDAADDAIRKYISFGVNDSEAKRLSDRSKFRQKRYMDLSSITFGHSITEFNINGYDMDNQMVRISYDRSSNILIGMDILKELDVHMGTTVDGVTVMLACKRGALTEDYREELNRLFDVKRVVLQ